ncbi:MAG: hypothetical protein JF607_24290 [Burkholderiales bacterium]|nr:hypothetical protein [Burkholderiales bacterium]
MNPTRGALPLASFWMGGYEGADHVNGSGEALDLVAATGHDERLDADYRAARRLGLRCVRESIGWRLSERDGHFDLDRAVRMAEAARRQGVQILWTLMHYGLPSDLTLLDDALVPRFARFASTVARTLRPLCPGPRFYTPVNEISYLSWVASATGDMGPAGLPSGVAAEDSSVSGYLIKQRLVRAALAGMAAIRTVDPQARFLHVEPVVHVAARDGCDAEQCALARRIASYQWQALDMLAGRMDPQLGGHHLRDPRRQPLSRLLQEVWRRYRRPMIVAETGHIGVGRAAWLNEIAAEAVRARAAGVPLQGVCLYPLLDRPDWNDTQRWHRSGLFHLPTPQQRRLNRPYARALLSWRGLNEVRIQPDERPGLLVLLPCGFDDWRAPREQLLRALGAHGVVRLLEPPRASTAEPLLRHHGLGPAAELLVLHGRGAGGWTEPPTSAQLGLLREALQQTGPRRWVCWLAGWHAGGHPAWWRELAGSGLLLQPCPLQPPQGELLLRARATLPALWPAAGGRAPASLSYEAEEASTLLAGIPAPRLWLQAPPAPASCAALAGRLRELATRHGQQLLVDAAAPPSDEPWPPNLHWLGHVHDSLHAALTAQVQRVLPWGGLPGWAAFDGQDGPGDGHAASAQQLAGMVEDVLQAVLQLHLGLPGKQGEVTGHVGAMPARVALR